MARRTLPTALILSCCLTVIQAESAFGEDKGNSEGDSIKKPEPLVQHPTRVPGADSQIRLTPGTGVARTLGANTDDSKPKHVVHLNSTGVDAGYAGRRSPRSGAANRLRAIRSGDLLRVKPQNPLAEKAGPLNSNFPSIETPDVSPSTTSHRNAKQAGTASKPSQSVPTGTVPPTDAPLLITNPVADGQPSATDSVTEAGKLPSVVKRQSSRARPRAAVSALEPSFAEPSAEVASRPFTPIVPKPSTQADLQVTDGNNSTTGEFVRETPVTPADPVPFTNLKAETRLDTSSPLTGSSIETPRRNQNTITPTRQTPTEVMSRGHGDRMQLGSRLGASTRGSTAKVVGEQPRIAPPSRESAAEGVEKDNVLLSNRSPVLVVKTQGSPTIKVGRTATYYVTASNIGDLPAEDVEVEVNIPSWAEVTLNQATAGLVRLQPNQQGHSEMKWTISKLDPQAQQRLRLEFVPRLSQPIDLGVTWHFKSVSGLAQIQVQEPKLQMSVVGAPDIQFNDTKLYTITVSNPGSGDAENVVLTLLPIADGEGNAGVREMGTVKAGTRRTVEVELTARQAGELAVRATATADGGLHAQGEQRVRVRRANLEIETVGPTRKYAGTEARYAIKISNTGDATANDVVAEAALPMAAKYVNSSVGGSYDAARGKVRWSIRALQPGAFQIVELSINLMGEGKNRLDFRTSTADQLTATGSVTTEVESLADLKLLVNDPIGAVAVGTEMVYEVRIVNRGTKAAHHINIVGYFSEGIEPVSVQGWRADVEVGQVVFEQIPRIAPGQEMVVKVSAKASRPGDHVFRTELDSNDPETKLAFEEWTRFYGDDIGPTLIEKSEQHATAPQTLPPERLEQRR